MNELEDELMEEFVYEYEEELEEIDVDEIIANLKRNISDYIYENPDDEIPDEPKEVMDFGFENLDIPDEILEKLEPKDNILDFVGK